MMLIILKKGLLISLAVVLLLVANGLSGGTVVAAVSRQPYYQVGWQFTKSGNGFSIKIPVMDRYYVQPFFAYSMNLPADAGQSTARGHFSIGLRGICQLPARGDFQPYAGAGWGHSESFSGTASSTVITRGTTGYEAFLGVEYQKFVIRPTLEIGLGSYTRADGSYYAGTTFNLGLMYSF